MTSLSVWAGSWETRASYDYVFMPSREEPVHRYGRFASIEAAAIAGLLFAVLTLVSVTLLLRLPDASSASDIASFYDDPDERRLDFLALNLATFSALAFLWFIAVIRRRIGTREDRFFATVFLGSGLVYVGLMLAAAMML